MKIKPADCERFIRQPDPKCCAILLYGPDGGLVRERMNRLTRGVVEDPNDPFRIVELSEGDLKNDPARLADEAASISMLGGRRVIRLRGFGDSQAKTLEAFLDNPMGDALILVEGGELGARSPLRVLFEGAENAVAIACYADDARALENVIREKLAQEGLTPEPAALDYLLGNLGSDRGVTLSELEKLSLYMGADSGAPARGLKRTVTLQDVRACVGDNAGSSLDDVVDATVGGDLQALDAALARAHSADVNAIAILNALSRHLQQLHLALARMETGSDAMAALGAMRPPLHFSRKDMVRRQLGLWSRKRLDRAIDLALEAEGLCKTTGLPEAAICGQTLFRVAQGARAGRR